jgi:hypothetical protein
MTRNFNAALNSWKLDRLHGGFQKTKQGEVVFSYKHVIGGKDDTIYFDVHDSHIPGETGILKSTKVELV